MLSSDPGNRKEFAGLSNFTALRIVFIL